MSLPNRGNGKRHARHTKRRSHQTPVTPDPTALQLSQHSGTANAGGARREFLQSSGSLATKNLSQAVSISRQESRTIRIEGTRRRG
ncbi:MAG: hypothetical protein Fues2KO_16410 [Fuerstiella sp.]